MQHCAQRLGHCAIDRREPGGLLRGDVGHGVRRHDAADEGVDAGGRGGRRRRQAGRLATQQLRQQAIIVVHCGAGLMWPGRRRGRRPGTLLQLGYRLRKLGRVRGEGIQTQDVTRAYADLETRLKVKRETVGRLREILIRQTGKVTEVLAVEREIARVVEEIEQAEGERRYFDNQVSLSTLTLSLFEPASIVTPGALDPIVSALRQSVGLMSESIGNLIELFASGLPWLVALYLAWRLIRWRQRARP